MKRYNVIVKNFMIAEVYNEIILAKNENDAIIKMLSDVIIAEGDRIEIYEI